MQKEILTRDIIKQEFRKQQIWNAKGALIAFILSIALLCFMLYLFFINLINGVESLFMIAVSLFLVFVCCFALYKTVKNSLLADKDKFYITKDKLIRTEEKIVGRRLNRPYGLYFASYGLYSVLIWKHHYSWSKLYHMSDDGIYNTALLGDEYYLVIAEEKNILLAYNTKLFELKDQ